MSSDSVIRIIGICVVVLLIIGWISSRFITIIGINGKTGVDIAKEIVANHEDPSRCNTIHLIDFFPTPSEAVHRADCLHTVAELTKDPSSCAYLMPSDYGKDCVDNVLLENWKPANPPKCNEDTKQLSCYLKTPYDSNKPADTLYSYNACSTISDLVVRNDCYYGKSMNVDKNITDGMNSCSSITGDDQQKDVCFYLLSFSLKDKSICDKIQDSTKRSACDVQALMFTKK